MNTEFVYKPETEEGRKTIANCELINFRSGFMNKEELMLLASLVLTGLVLMVLSCTPRTNNPIPATAETGIGQAMPVHSNDMEEYPAEIDENYTVSGWINLGTISIPPDWHYTITEFGPTATIEIFGEVASGPIHMAAWTVMVGNPYMIRNLYSSQQAFSFNDGRGGYMLTERLSWNGTLVLWLPESGLALSLYYDGDDSVFTENEELILKIARTLRNVWPVVSVEVLADDVESSDGYAAIHDSSPEYPIEIGKAYVVSNWIDLGVINIPPEWTYTITEAGPFSSIDVFGEGVSSPIHMAVWGVMVGNPYMIVNEFSSQQPFSFGDGRSGYILKESLFESDGTLVLWLQHDSWIALSLYYDGDDSVFTENEELILKIARTLTDNWRGVVSTN